MRPVSIAVMVLCALGCGDDDALPSLAPDAGDTAVDDAGPGDAGTDSELRSALHDFLTAYDHQVSIRCPCKVEQGDFASVDECTDKIGGELRFFDCFSTMLAPEDSAELRQALRCQTDELEQRNTCLEAASCTDDDVVPCLTDKLGCPMFNPQTLTRVLQCPGAAMLGR